MNLCEIALTPIAIEHSVEAFIKQMAIRNRKIGEESWQRMIEDTGAFFLPIRSSLLVAPIREGRAIVQYIIPLCQKQKNKTIRAFSVSL